MTRFDRATSQQLASLQATAGRTVTYSRDAQTVEITAIQAHSRYERQDTSGLTTELVVDDWLFDPGDLVLAGEPVEPEVGDRITVASPTENQPGLTLIYELLAPSPDAPVWRYSDPGRRRIRVHTKLVDVQQA